MDTCRACGTPLDDVGLTNCEREECDRDRTRHKARVERIKASLSIEAIARMERGDMPECFELTRAGATALAGLLMAALRQNQEMAARLKAVSEESNKIH
jgi:hypothetical protein